MVILVWARIPTRGQTVTADHSRMGSAMMLSLHCFSPPGVRSSLFVKVGECLYALVGGSMWCLLIICAIDGEWYSVGASELEWRICRRESMVFMYTIDMDPRFILIRIKRGRSLQTSWSPTKTWIHLIGHSVPCYWQHSVCFIFAADELYGSLSPNHSGGGLQAVHNWPAVAVVVVVVVVVVVDPWGVFCRHLAKSLTLLSTLNRRGLDRKQISNQQ